MERLVSGKVIAAIIITILIIIGISTFVIIKYKNSLKPKPLETDRVFLKVKGDSGFIDAKYIMMYNGSEEDPENNTHEGRIKSNSWEEIYLSKNLAIQELCAYSESYHFGCQHCTNNSLECTVRLERIGAFEVDMARIKEDEIGVRIINTIEDSTLKDVILCVGWSTGTLTTGYIDFFSDRSKTDMPSKIDDTNRFYKCFLVETIKDRTDVILTHTNYELTNEDEIRIIVADKIHDYFDSYYFEGGRDVGAENKEVSKVV